jgi:hypothetical protein
VLSCACCFHVHGPLLNSHFVLQCAVADTRRGSLPVDLNYSTARNTKPLHCNAGLLHRCAKLLLFVYGTVKQYKD